MVGCAASSALHASRPTTPLEFVVHDQDAIGPRVLVRGWVWVTVDPLSHALLVDPPHFRLLEHERVIDVAPYEPSPFSWAFGMAGGRGRTFLVTREPMLSRVWREADVTWCQWRDARWHRMDGLPPERVVEWDGGLAALYRHPLGSAPRLVRHPSGAEIPGIEVDVHAIAPGPRGVGGVVFGLCDQGLCAQRLTQHGLSAVEHFHVPASPSDAMWAFASAHFTLVVAAAGERSFAAVHDDARGWRPLDLPFERVADVSVDEHGEVWLVGATERNRASGRTHAPLYHSSPSQLARGELDEIPLDGALGSALLQDERGVAVGVRAVDGVAYVLIHAGDEGELVYVDPREARIAQAGYHVESCDDGRRRLRALGRGPAHAVSDERELARRIAAVPGVASVGWGTCCGDDRACLRVYRDRDATPDSLVEVAERLAAAGGSGIDVGFYAASDLVQEE